MPRPKQSDKHYPARPCCIAGCPNWTHEGWPATRCRTCNVQFVRDWRVKNKARHEEHERTEKLRRLGVLPRLNPADRIDWRAKAKDAGHRRRANQKGCVVSKADLRLVAERSGDVCPGCKAYVPEGLRQFDHVVPLAGHEGPHAEENLRILCSRCNGKKGKKLDGEWVPDSWTKEALPDQPFLFNPDWKDTGPKEDWISNPFRVTGRVTFGKSSWLIVRTEEWPDGVPVPRGEFEAGRREWSVDDVIRWERDVRDHEDAARTAYERMERDRNSQYGLDLDL